MPRWRRCRRRPQRLEPIYETVRQVAAALPPETTFLGFAGAPWTVATYMVAGEGIEGPWRDARTLAYRDPAGFAAIIAAIDDRDDRLSERADRRPASMPCRCSTAGRAALRPTEFDRWVIAPTARIVAALKARHPDVPVIGFPKGAGGRLADYAREVGADAIGLDETVDPVWADAVLPAGAAGAGQSRSARAARRRRRRSTQGVARIRQAFADRPHVFNLGHGIGQFTPIAHVERLLELVRTRGMIGWLGDAYPWVKAAHLIFVIFWMAGLFMLPRYLVYHQEALGNSAEEARWVEREGKLRHIILTPAMIAVWVLGLSLALNDGIADGAPGLGWLHTKIAAGRAAVGLSWLGGGLCQEARDRPCDGERQDAAAAQRGAGRGDGADRDPGDREAVLRSSCVLPDAIAGVDSGRGVRRAARPTRCRLSASRGQRAARAGARATSAHNPA